MTLSKSDQHFIDIMVPHHQAGIKMARDALPTSTDPKVRKLLEHVIEDQGQEVKMMMEWGAKPDSGSMMQTMADKPGLGEAGHPNPLHPDPVGGLKAMPGTDRSAPEPVHDW
jgi:hypothetical protein